jgi:hypothetical protein
MSYSGAHLNKSYRVIARCNELMDTVCCGCYELTSLKSLLAGCGEGSAIVGRAGLTGLERVLILPVIA